MDNNLLKKKISSSWYLPSALENAEGPIVALDSEQNELRFSTYYIKGKFFSKIWPWQFGNSLVDIKAPGAIHYWKMLKDCHFESLDWKPISKVPKNDEEILCWINYGKWDQHNQNSPLVYQNRIILLYPVTRLHFGTFYKGIFGGKYLNSGLYELEKIPWNDIFRWTTVDDFAEHNEDPREFQLDPLDYFGLDWMSKKP